MVHVVRRLDPISGLPILDDCFIWLLSEKRVRVRLLIDTAATATTIRADKIRDANLRQIAGVTVPVIIPHAAEAKKQRVFRGMLEFLARPGSGYRSLSSPYDGSLGRQELRNGVFDFHIPEWSGSLIL